ncbi:MAG: glutathione peroxidase, partial [Brevinema sp.]
GKNADPLYVWLKEQAPTDIGDAETKAFEASVKMFTLGNKKEDIKWNFGKFVIDKNGNVAERFSPALTPDKMEMKIIELLG